MKSSFYDSKFTPTSSSDISDEYHQAQACDYTNKSVKLLYTHIVERMPNMSEEGAHPLIDNAMRAFKLVFEKDENSPREYAFMMGIGALLDEMQ